ncbi:MAG: NADH-quinone oxidoreductase subunit NuoE [Chitinophagales bacterium]|jgi:NADH-quinone oxidoreductase subunit E|nr:NAD(P)H-dependent oxidoreductase subunit E [Sphingobacteriales bacterium]
MVKVTEAPEKPQFKAETLQEVQRIIAQYPEGKQKSAILRVLHLAQAEFGGWLSVNTMNYVAEILNLKPIEVYEVASFYSMYNLKPVGKYMLEFCHTATCATAGVESLIDYTCKKLGVKTGETTADGLFTIKEVECLGACGYAPMLQLGKSYREHLTPEKIDALIEELRTKK